MIKSTRSALVLICMFSLILSSCRILKSASINMWTWISGSDTVNHKGSYGTQGSAATSNVPGSRNRAVSWVDSSGNRWLFGGQGYDSNGAAGFLNDLWKFDGSNWTWMSGSDTVNHKGSYGTQGSAATDNVPGARWDAVSWIDSSGNLWLFGGLGYDSNGAAGYLNDLWKFDGSNWTWMSGSDTVNQTGSYGTNGVPGARYGAVSWFDGSNLWLFGGEGYNSSTTGYLNDLWKFSVSGTYWTWVSGSSSVDRTGSYGTSTGTTGVPGSRNRAVSWLDGNGNLWLFGGWGYNSSTTGYLNDLWKFSVSNSTWTWVSGSDTANQSGSYGTEGSSATSNVPGARYGAVSWFDGSYLWLFGGLGYDSNGAASFLNDLWKFDGSNWTWISGSNTVGQYGTYGTEGSSATGNVPGARWGAVSWIDSSGNLWLFGGWGYDSIGTTGTNYYLNDLWYYQP